jgi:hypothetical protein
MATIKKAKAGIRMKKAEDGVSQAGVGPSSDEKERQFGKTPAKSQAGVGPSSNEKERQGDKSTSTKAPPNSFRSEAAEAAAKSSAPKKTRGQEYAAARKRGDKTFDYEGKKYTTESAEEKVARVSKSAPASKSATPAKPAASAPAKKTEAPVTKSASSSKPESSKKPYQPFPNSSESETSSKKSTPAKKTEPPKSITTSPKLSPQDSVLNRMRINNNILMEKQNRYAKKPFGSALKNGGKMKKKC